MESDIFLRWQAILFTIDGPKMLFQNLVPGYIQHRTTKLSFVVV